MFNDTDLLAIERTIINLQKPTTMEIEEALWYVTFPKDWWKMRMITNRFDVCDLGVSFPYVSVPKEKVGLDTVGQARGRHLDAFHSNQKDYISATMFMQSKELEIYGRGEITIKLLELFFLYGEYCSLEPEELFTKLRMDVDGKWVPRSTGKTNTTLLREKDIVNVYNGKEWIPFIKETTTYRRLDAITLPERSSMQNRYCVITDVSWYTEFVGDKTKIRTVCMDTGRVSYISEIDLNTLYDTMETITELTHFCEVKSAMVDYVKTMFIEDAPSLLIMLQPITDLEHRDAIIDTYRKKAATLNYQIRKLREALAHVKDFRIKEKVKYLAHASRLTSIIRQLRNK